MCAYGWKKAKRYRDVNLSFLLCSIPFGDSKKDYLRLFLRCSPGFMHQSTESEWCNLFIPWKMLIRAAKNECCMETIVVNRNHHGA